MASIEKLIKSFEALKVIQTPIDRPEEALVSTRFIKRESTLTKKDKCYHCNTIADIISSPNLRNIEDFHKFLGIAIETFLVCCDDPDSDVRMIANECLNRTINNLLDSQLGRLQVELYKEIKKNGSVRVLRAALSRFADLCHLTRPAKCRPYVQNLFPCLIKISGRTDEDALQETLRNAISKIMPVFGTFAGDSEIIALLTAFLPNLQCTMPNVRRTAATSLVVICQYSRKPHVFFSWLLSHLLQSFNSHLLLPINRDQFNEQLSRDRILIGIFLCLKHMIPQLYEIPSHNEFESLKSFCLNSKQKESIAKDYDAITENLLQIYELLLYNLRFNNSYNVILASLEALHNLLKYPPKFILPYLIDSNGIDKSRIGNLIVTSTPASPLTLQRKRLYSGSTNSVGCSSENVASLYDDDDGKSICGITTFNSKSVEELRCFQLSKEKMCDIEDEDESGISISESQSLPSNLDIPKISTETHTNPIDQSPSKHGSLGVQAMQLTYVDSEETCISEMQVSPSPSTADFEPSDDKHNCGDIGEFTTENIASLEYCCRLLCSQFLLMGSQGNLISDKKVRVSIKALTLNCIAAILRLHPISFIIDIHIDSQLTSDSKGDVSSQKIWDIIKYSNHPDPQLRGTVALVIGQFIREILKLRINYNEFLINHCSMSAFPEAPTLEDLLSTLLSIVFDKQNSSIAIKNGLFGLRLCIIQLIESNDSINMTALNIIRDIIKLKNNPYWLIKVELIEIFSGLPFKAINHLESSLESHGMRGIFIEKSNLQNTIVHDVLLNFIADDDFRVRNAASASLIRLIPLLLPSVSRCDNDPITALALEHAILNAPTIPLYELMNKTFKDVNIPTIEEFSDPLKYSKKDLCDNKHLIEVNLENIIKLIVQQLMTNMENKYAIIGYCQTLSILSEKYAVITYPQSWGCDMTKSSLASQLISIMLSILSSNATVVSDLNTHQHVLKIVGNLIEGLSYYCYTKSNVNETENIHNEFRWGILSKDLPQLTTQMEVLFSHLLKLLYMCSCLIDEASANVMTSSSGINVIAKTPVIHTLSNSSLSPIRKKPSKGLESEKFEEKQIKKNENDKSEKEKSKIQLFSNPLLMRLFDVLKASFSSSKTSMEFRNERISSFLQVTLKVMSKMMELSTLKFIAKYSEEILNYLKVIISIEPTDTVRVVRQLLKCIFGTNFAVMIDRENKLEPLSNQRSEKSSRPSHSIIGSSVSYGLYQCSIAAPYIYFTQFYASKTTGIGSVTQEMDVYTNSSFMRKKIERRVSLILDKNVASQSQSINSSFAKTALTSHIRLFEPVVIKALKQYTVTSDIELQCEVLDLLSQLVQLRVNYCLLDSDQIFIGFVLKQFEFIEGGQLKHFDKLISHIFFFLILLSYERYHSKPIIGVSKIIQLCDGLIAGCAQPEKFAFPAFHSLVEDLILHRNANKVDSSKELEAQREVIVANLLKLVQYPDIIKLLLLIIRQSHKEGEEKWKKISRQTIDTILPLLIKQNVIIDDYESLETLHELFESVSSSVFRPADILLKAMFAAPQPDLLNNCYYFHRWISLIIVVLRVLIVQTKEETVLTRLDDMKSSIETIGPFGLPVIQITPSNNSNSMIPFHMLSVPNLPEVSNLKPEEMFSVYLLQIIQLCAHEISKRIDSIYEDVQNHCKFLMQQLSYYLLMLTHMFQSGTFRRVAKSAMLLIKSQQCMDLESITDESINDDACFGGFLLSLTNSKFLNLISSSPTLVLQWFNILMLLNYEDNNQNGLWNQLISPSVDTLSPLQSRTHSGVRRGSCNKSKGGVILSPNREIIRRGTLILLCDFICENMKDADQMTRLIVQNINDIVKWSNELPISEFISTIHRNPASSGLFIQAINARCDENLMRSNFVKRLLRCIESVHPTQSSALVSFIIEKIICNQFLQGNHLLLRLAEEIACSRLSIMTSSFEGLSQEMISQISIDDLDKMISSICENRFWKLKNKLEMFKAFINDPTSPSQSHPLFGNSDAIKLPDANKEWFLDILKKYCQKNHKNHKASFLLNKLSYDDLLSVISEKDFDLDILGNCIDSSGISKVEDYAKSSNTNQVFSTVINRNILLKASLNTIIQHVNDVASKLPSPHYAFLPHSEMNAPKEARHRDKIIELFNSTLFWDNLFFLSSGFASFLRHYQTQQSISSDLLKNIVRTSILYAEAALYITETPHLVSLLNLISVLKIMESTIKCHSIFAYLSVPENISFQCSFIAAIHSVVKHFYGDFQPVSEPENFHVSERENPEWKHAHRACIRMSQLILFIENENDRNDTAVASIIGTYCERIILTTAQLPLVNSFIMVPPSVWTINLWKPNFSGDYGTIVQTVPSEYLHDIETLNQFSFRVFKLGWNGRVQFEEIWMSLLGIMGSLPIPGNNANGEQSEHILINCATVDIITKLLLMSTLTPQPGNPVYGKYIKQKTEKISGFLHTRYGEKLTLIREPLDNAIKHLLNTHNFNETSEYSFGHVSIETIRHTIKINSTPTELSPSISSGSSSSSSGHSPMSPVLTSISPLLQDTVRNEKLEIDLNSCFHFLRDHYGQILTAQQQMQFALITEIVKSIVLISDLFTEKVQFEWMLETFYELYHSAQIAEDEIIMQYLVIGICKSSAVLGLENEQIVERTKKCVDTCLKSPFLATRIASLHGLFYVLESRGNGKETSFLPLASEYILRHIGDDSLPSSHNVEHVELMWKLSFHLIKTFVEDFTESDFGQKIFQISMKTLMSTNNTNTFITVINGLENLLLFEKFTIRDANEIMKNAFERFKLANSQLFALSSLKLIVSSTYFIGCFGMDVGQNIENSEDFLMAMEKLTLIFDRLKTCRPFEASHICRMLPHFLCDFFPTQDILNKCIGEFLSGQQTHAQHLASTLFQLFNNLLGQSRHDIVHEWVLLSLSSFTQIIPLPNAIWSLSIFLISASTNIWIRYIFPYVQTRLGLLEESDRQLFNVIIQNFYNELKGEKNCETFRLTFESVAELNSPYADALRYIK